MHTYMGQYYEVMLHANSYQQVASALAGFVSLVLLIPFLFIFFFQEFLFLFSSEELSMSLLPDEELCVQKNEYKLMFVQWVTKECVYIVSFYLHYLIVSTIIICIKSLEI